MISGNGSMGHGYRPAEWLRRAWYYFADGADSVLARPFYVSLADDLDALGSAAGLELRLGHSLCDTSQVVQRLRAWNPTPSGANDDTLRLFLPRDFSQRLQSATPNPAR